jgi:hypothetical protein
MAEATVALPTPAPAASNSTPGVQHTPGGNPPASSPSPAPAGFSIPDEFKDKPYLKGVDSHDKLFKMLDGAQELIGKRPAGIPAPDAPQAEWDKFYDAVGRPKTAAEYQFEIDQSVKADVKVLGKIKEIMHKYGLTPTQAKGLQKDFDAFGAEIAKARGESLQIQNTNFDKLGAELFGVDRDKVMANGKTLLEQFTPPQLKGEVAKLSNEQLMVLAGVLKGISEKYIKADGAPHAQPAGGSNPDSLRAEARTLMATPAYSNPMDPNHAATCARINEIYKLASGK